jgi:FkbM family methyltransferase
VRRQRARYRRGVASIERLIAIAGGPAEVRTVFDVGANDGAVSLAVAARQPAIRFVAVEPTPALAEQLRAASTSLPNFDVVECAIAAEPGERLLNVMPYSVLNSLEPVNERELERVGVNPAGYTAQERVPVSVRRLEDVCEELGVDRIDVLHVDAQGTDLEVLQSAGALLATVRAGAVEVGRRINVYANTVSRSRFVDYLHGEGFRIVDVVPNDYGNLEQDLLFAGPPRPLSPRDRLRARAITLRGDARWLAARIRITPSRTRARVRLRTRLRGWARPRTR